MLEVVDGSSVYCRRRLKVIKANLKEENQFKIGNSCRVTSEWLNLIMKAVAPPSIEI